MRDDRLRPGSQESAQLVHPTRLDDLRHFERFDRPGAFDADSSEFHLAEILNLVWTHRWAALAMFLSTVVLTVAWVATQPRLYRSTARIAIETATPQIIQGQFNTGPSYWEMERYVSEQIYVLTSRRIAGKVAERLGMVGEQQAAGFDPSDDAAGMLVVSPVTDTSVLNVSMVGSDPERITEWLTLYVQVYIETHISDNVDRTREVYEVISSRLDPLRDKLDESERQLMEFKERQDGLLFADQDKNVISEQINTLTTEYAQTKADRIRLETKLNALRRLRQSGLAEGSFSEVLGDTFDPGAPPAARRPAGPAHREAPTYREEHPVIRDLRTRIASIEKRLDEQITTLVTSTQTDYEIALSREQSLFNNIQQLKAESIQLSKQTLQYDQLRREYEQDETFLGKMMARSKEADISSTFALNNIRVIDNPVKPTRALSAEYRRSRSRSARKPVLCWRSVCAFALEYLDQSIRTPEQVNRLLGLDVLAAVPRYKKESVRVLRESFQSLRTALLLASRSEGCQVVMVTSAVPAEGKTTVAFNLAKVLAAGGERVLLIDSDLRRPRMHRIINAKNVRGLTSVVLGEREIRDVIHALADVPNLDLITSGPLPPNPPELFGKASMRAMLAKAREEYQWVILDTPPIASVTDPVICSQLVDLAVIVVQHGGAKRELIRDCVRLLSRSGVIDCGRCDEHGRSAEERLLLLATTPTLDTTAKTMSTGRIERDACAAG